MAAVCSSVLQNQCHEPLEMGFGGSRVSLDTWAGMSKLRPVRTSSSTSLCASSSMTLEGLPRAKSTLTLDIARCEEDEAFTRESGCVTPKSNEHRIPDVDVDFCPPAPKKTRGQGRLALICAMESEKPSIRRNLNASPSYLF